MADVFDPYFKWLAIPEEEQPPNHYQLLGIPPLTDDPDVIDNAADRQAAHIKTFVDGGHGEHAQLMLGEIQAAKQRLLNPEKKKAYDDKLRAKLVASGKQTKPAAKTKATSVPPKKQPSAGPTIDVAPAIPKESGSRAPLLAGIFVVLLIVTAGFYWFVLRDGSSADVAVKPRKDIQQVQPKPASPPPGETPAKPNSTEDRVAVDESTNPDAPDDPPDQAADKDNASETTRPDPKPEPPEQGDPKPSTPNSAAPGPSPPEQLAAPSDEEQQRALQVIRELYQQQSDEAKTPPQKAALAQTLLGEASKNDDDHVARFVFLRLARDFAVQGADLKTAASAIDAMAKHYKIDATEMKMTAVTALAKNVKGGTANEAFAKELLVLVAAAVRDDQFESAQQLATLAMTTARKTRDTDLKKATAARGKEVAEIAEAYAAAEQALATLDQKPEDAAANLAAGRYYCFVKNDWQRGMPHLAAGSDADLTGLAQRELADAEPADAKQLADDWWDAAMKEQGLARHNAQRHAASWALKDPNLRKGLTWIRWQKRFKQIPDFQPGGSIAAAAPKTPSKKPTVEDHPDFASLLARIDTYEKRCRDVPHPKYAARVFEAEGSSFSHSYGEAEEDGWSVTPGKHKQGGGAMIYGPYLTDVPGGGPHTAIFRIMVGDIQKNANLVNIDVSDPDLHHVLTTRSIQAREIKQDMEYIDVPLHFFCSADHRLEFRVWWTGNSYIKIDRVTLKPCEALIPQDWNLTLWELPEHLKGGGVNDAAWREVISQTPIGQRHVSQLIYRWGKLVGAVATSKLDLPPGRYRLTTICDDGIRVLINNQTRISRWWGHPAVVDTIPLTIKRGEKPEIRVEYFNNWGAGDLQLWIQPES